MRQATSIYFVAMPNLPHGDSEPRPGNEALQPITRGHLPMAAETVPAVRVKKSFGLPTGVSLVVPLPRAPSEREWEQLISEFRTAFDTQGHVTVSGGLREWHSGKLHISLEPTEHGEQLRFTDRKEEAVALNGLGVMLLAFAGIVGSVVTLAGDGTKGLTVLGAFGGFSLIPFFSAHLTRTPAWARDRQRQMLALAERATRLLSNP